MFRKNPYLRLTSRASLPRLGKMNDKRETIESERSARIARRRKMGSFRFFTNHKR